MVAGGRRDAVFEPRKPAVRPRPSDSHGPLLEEPILLRAGAIIRNERRMVSREMIDYLLLRDPGCASNNAPADGRSEKGEHGGRLPQK